jgi:hypothetical protein
MPSPIQDSFSGPESRNRPFFSPWRLLWVALVLLALYAASCRQSSTASAFCCAVNRRLVLVGEFIDGQSGGHGVTPIDLSLKSGEAHTFRLKLRLWPAT